MKTWKSLLCFLISYCVAAYPVHAGVPSTHQEILQFFKDSGITKGGTVADFLNRNSENFHPKVAALAERYALLNPDEKLPEVKITNFKTKEGQEITRLVLQEGKKSTLVDIITQGEDTFFKIDGQKLTYEDIYYDGYLEAAVSSPILTANELARGYEVDKQKAILYQTNLRKYADAVMDLRNAQLEAGVKTSGLNPFLSYAYADGTQPAGSRSSETDDASIQRVTQSREPNCIMAGFPAVVDNGSCGGGETDLKCNGKSSDTRVKCNPYVYGFDSSTKGMICVDEKPATEVSKKCDAVFPIPEKASELIQSVITHSDKANTQDLFFRGLNGTVRQASKICLNWKSEDFSTYLAGIQAGNQPKKYEAKDFEYKFPGARGEHHRNACATVMNRLFIMKSSEQCVRDTIVANDSGEKENSPSCGAAAGAALSGQGKPAVKKKSNNNWIYWALGGAALAACIFWLCKSKKKKGGKHPPMPVGKPGESITGGSRPAGGGGVGAGGGGIDSGKLVPQGGTN